MIYKDIDTALEDNRDGRLTKYKNGSSILDLVYNISYLNSKILDSSHKENQLKCHFH